jgi:D,D-heptose 1,7-bisphosphate phosphatase
MLKEHNYLIIVITNQSGIARGFFTEEDLAIINLWMRNELKVDDIYYCPHHKEKGMGIYRQDCNCRKPRNGLYLKAIQKYDINVKESYAIGDKITDLIPAKELGIKTILVKTGYGKNELADKQKSQIYIDTIRENLFEAVKSIIYSL